MDWNVNLTRFWRYYCINQANISYIFETFFKIILRVGAVVIIVSIYAGKSATGGTKSYRHIFQVGACSGILTSVNELWLGIEKCEMQGMKFCVYRDAKS